MYVFVLYVLDTVYPSVAYTNDINHNLQILSIVKSYTISCICNLLRKKIQPQGSIVLYYDLPATIYSEMVNDSY